MPAGSGRGTWNNGDTDLLTLVAGLPVTRSILNSVHGRL